MTSTDNIKRVRIFNDTGMGYSTIVSDAETGARIEGVTFISLNIRSIERMQAIIHVANPVIDVVANADIRHVCPCCKREMTDE